MKIILFLTTVAFLLLLSSCKDNYWIDFSTPDLTVDTSETWCPEGDTLFFECSYNQDGHIDKRYLDLWIVLSEQADYPTKEIHVSVRKKDGSICNVIVIKKSVKFSNFVKYYFCDLEDNDIIELRIYDVVHKPYPGIDTPPDKVFRYIFSP